MAGISIANGVVATDPTVNGSFTNPTISGGTASGQALSSETITASTVDSTPIGATTPSTGKFTTLTATSGVPIIRAQSAVASSVTGTLTETVLASVPISAGAMGANGRLRVTFHYTYTNSANNKICKITLGGTTIFSRTVTTTISIALILELMNRGATNSQIELTVSQNAGTPYSGGGGTPNNTYSIDMSQATTLDFRGTLANTGETITLEAYGVEILNP